MNLMTIPQKMLWQLRLDVACQPLQAFCNDLVSKRSTETKKQKK